MNQTLHNALRSDLILAQHEDAFIIAARTLYRTGLTPQHISASQMAALGEPIRTALHLTEAKQTVRVWLEHQMQKLAEREQCGERPPATRPWQGGNKEATATS